jgi:hypothetical protein
VAENLTRIAVGVLGFFVGGAVGAFIGVFASYAIAERITDSRETQAYLTLLVIPAVGFVGAITTLAALAWATQRRGLPIAVAGGMVLAVVLALGASWRHVSRPARVRVQNASDLAFERVHLGGDFRRSTAIGGLAPGETSRAIEVDLDKPGTFDALEGGAGDGYVRHRLTREESAALPDGDYVWIVRGGADGLTYELAPDSAP